MTDRWPLSVRLTREKHALVKAAAAEEGTSMPRLMARLLTDYAAGPIPKRQPRATPQSELMRTLVQLPDDVRDAAEQRARAEGRSLSQVVADLVAAGK